MEISQPEEGLRTPSSATGYCYSMEPLSSYTPPDTQECGAGREGSTDGQDAALAWTVAQRCFSCHSQAKQTSAGKPRTERNLNELVGVTVCWRAAVGGSESGAPGGISGQPGAWIVGQAVSHEASGWRVVLALASGRCWVSHTAPLPPTRLLSISRPLPSTSVHSSCTMATYEFPLGRSRWCFIATGCQLPLGPSWSPLSLSFCLSHWVSGGLPVSFPGGWARAPVPSHIPLLWFLFP